MVYPTHYFLSKVKILIIKHKHEDYCLVCKKVTDNINSKMVKTKNNRVMLLSQCSNC